MNHTTASRRHLWLLALAAVAGFILVAVVTALPDPPRDDIEALTERVYWLIGTLVVLAVPLVAAAAVLWQIGQRAAETRRFPPAGEATAGRRAAVEGPAAVRRGRALQTVALVVGISSILAPLVIFLIVREMLAGT